MAVASGPSPTEDAERAERRFLVAKTTSMVQRLELTIAELRAVE
jgi:hypothetical protein